MALFTIITINLNNKEGLKRTISSLLAQTFTDYEFIVVDGNSIDGSIEVIDGFRNNIHKIIIEKDNGVYNAMNKGLRLATGKYIQFLNSGDELRGAEALRIISENIDGSDLLYTDVELFGGSRLHEKLHPDQISLRYQLTDMICHQAIFASAKLFSLTGPFDEAYRVYGDYDWIMNAIRRKKAKTRHLAEILIRYQEMGLSQSTQTEIQLREKDAIHNKYFNPFLLFIYRIYRIYNKRVYKGDAIKN